MIGALFTVIGWFRQSRHDLEIDKSTNRFLESMKQEHFKMTKSNETTDPATKGSYDYMEGRQAQLHISAGGADAQPYYDAAEVRCSYRAGFDHGQRELREKMTPKAMGLGPNVGDLIPVPQIDQQLLDAINLMNDARAEVAKAFGLGAPKPAPLCDHFGNVAVQANGRYKCETCGQTFGSMHEAEISARVARQGGGKRPNPAPEAAPSTPAREAEDDGKHWLIHKAGRGWYRPKAEGYTNKREEAGRYTKEEALSYSHPNGWDGPRDGIEIEHVGIEECGNMPVADGWKIIERQDYYPREPDGGMFIGYHYAEGPGDLRIRTNSKTLLDLILHQLATTYQISQIMKDKAKQQ